MAGSLDAIDDPRGGDAAVAAMVAVSAIGDL